MRISDWSSDVCSSDLPSLALDPRVKPEGDDRGWWRRSWDCHGQCVNAESTGPQARSLPGAPFFAPDLVRSERAGELADVAEELLQQGQVTALGGRLAADRIAVLRIGRSEEHTSELQSLMRLSYAVFC